jgi:peptidoglycan/xylan/chitin deacetylase (PgdA/CDA1 family)
VWLSFDDGPHPVATPAVLEVLKQERVHAVFFLLGSQAVRHPEIVRRIRDEGHVIGSHSDEHRAVWFRPRAEVVNRLRVASESIERSGGGRPSLFRPPYGRLDPSTPVHARAAGLTTMMFTVNSWDFAGGPVASTAERVMQRTKPGDIILLHDNDRTSAFAGDLVCEIVRRGRQAGLIFGRPIA